jgi:hypothetical protein
MATFPPLRQLRIKTWTKHIESGWKPDPAAAEKLDVNEDESSNSLDCLLMEGSNPCMPRSRRSTPSALANGGDELWLLARAAC